MRGHAPDPAPKEQPPRKLSGKGTAFELKLWKEEHFGVPAEGATGLDCPGNLSGQQTEGAPDFETLVSECALVC